MPVEIFLPKMTDYMRAGEIIRWLVEEGDQVEKGQPVLEVETDKATIEVEAPARGTIKGIRSGVQPGTTVPVGETIAFVAMPDEEVPTLPRLDTEHEPSGPRDMTSPSSTGEMDTTSHDLNDSFSSSASSEPVRASRTARRAARDLGVDLTDVAGTGPQGRITEKDVRARAQKPGASPPQAAMSDDVAWLEPTPTQRLTGKRMVKSLEEIPQFSLSVEVDMTNLLRLRDEQVEGSDDASINPPSVTIFLIKAVASILPDMPRLNSSFESGRIKQHNCVNIGVAIGSDAGLVVPVVQNADRKSLLQIAEEIRAFRTKAEEMKFRPKDLSGATFTVSNLGMYGVDHFNAIIPPPESAILAVGRIAQVPRAMPDQSVAIRPVVAMTLTVDHRVLDGIHGARFLAELRETIESSDQFGD